MKSLEKSENNMKKLKTKTSSNEKDLLRAKINELCTALKNAKKEIDSLNAKIKDILAEM